MGPNLKPILGAVLATGMALSSGVAARTLGAEAQVSRQLRPLPVSLAAREPGPLNLDKVLRRGRRANLRALQLAARRDALLAERLRALGPDDPSLSAVAYGPGSALGQAGTAQYQASQSFGFPGKASARARSLSLQAGTLDSEIRVGLLEGDREVKRAYAEAWFADQALQLNASGSGIFDRIVELARLRRVKGTTSEVEYLRAEASLVLVQDRRADLETRGRDAQAALDSLMGLPPSRALQLQAPAAVDPQGHPFPGPPGPPPGSPLWETAELQVQADRAQLRSVRRGGLPDLAASVVESQGQFGGGLALTVPLWYWFSERHAVEAAQARVRAGREGALEVRRELWLEIERKRARLSGLARKLRNYRDRLIPLDGRAYKLALSNYHYGQIDYNSLEAAANAWLDAQMEQEALRRNYRMAVADLDYLVGK